MPSPRTVAAALTLASLAGAAHAQPLRCPPGYHYWRDGWGNAVCRSFDATPEMGSSFPLPPAFGDRSVGPRDGSTLYPLQKGCLTGFQSWRDLYGNLICRPF